MPIEPVESVPRARILELLDSIEARPEMYGVDCVEIQAIYHTLLLLLTPEGHRGLVREAFEKATKKVSGFSSCCYPSAYVVNIKEMVEILKGIRAEVFLKTE